MIESKNEQQESITVDEILYHIDRIEKSRGHQLAGKSWETVMIGTLLAMIEKIEESNSKIIGQLEELRDEI